MDVFFSETYASRSTNIIENMLGPKPGTRIADMQSNTKLCPKRKHKP